MRYGQLISLWNEQQAIGFFFFGLNKYILAHFNFGRETPTTTTTTVAILCVVIRGRSESMKRIVNEALWVKIDLFFAALLCQQRKKVQNKRTDIKIAEEWNTHKKTQYEMIMTTITMTMTTTAAATTTTS